MFVHCWRDHFNWACFLFLKVMAFFAWELFCGGEGEKWEVDELIFDVRCFCGMKEVDRVWLEELKRCDGICGREHECCPLNFWKGMMIIYLPTMELNDVIYNYTDIQNKMHENKPCLQNHMRFFFQRFLCRRNKWCHVLIGASSKQRRPPLEVQPLTVMLEGHLHNALFVDDSISLMEEILHQLIW